MVWGVHAEEARDAHKALCGMGKFMEFGPVMMIAMAIKSVGREDADAEAEQSQTRKRTRAGP